MALHPALLAVNHLLEREAWARERLAPFGGRTVRLRLPPLPDLVAVVTADGRFDAAVAVAQADLTVRMKPGALPLLVARDDRVAQAVETEGDTDLAQAIFFLARNLRWDVEEDLSRILGDAAAHRAVNTGRSLLAWQRDAAQRFGENVAEYLREESGTLVASAEARTFAEAVAAARDDVERLEKRLERIAAALER